MNSKGQGIPSPVKKWYDAYGAVDAFNHCKVAGGKHGWEHRIKLHDNPNFPLFFTETMSFIDANIYLHNATFFPRSSQHHKSC